MSEYDHNQSNMAGDCKPLMEACTPFVYRHNAFRITGLPVVASLRDIKRRIDDLKLAEEVGDSEDEHTHAYALKPPPTFEQIREAGLKLQDPECRIVEEFFWFWPMEWDSGKHDAALQALANGDKTTAYQHWRSISKDRSERSLVSKHNLAVMYQMAALDGELISLKSSLTEDSSARLEKYWRTSFVWWEELADCEPFWSLVRARIRIIDDPRLTTGFARRMCAALPIGLDNINASLALKYVEIDKLELARKHIAFMKETHQGLDDVSQTFALITDPLKTRIRDAIEKAKQVAEQSPIKAAEAAEELFKTTRDPLVLIKHILPPEDHGRIDLCDAVAESGMDCVNAFALEMRDFTRCLDILTQARDIAESEESRQNFSETMKLVQGAALLEPVLTACEEAAATAQYRPEDALLAAQELLTKTRDTQRQMEHHRVSTDMRNRANNEIAAAVMHCAIVFGNKTQQWKPCAGFLERSLFIAVDSELKAHIKTNLDIALRNARVQASSSARGVSNSYGHQQPSQHSSTGCLVAIVLTIIAIVFVVAIPQNDSSSQRTTSQSPSRPSQGVRSPSRNTSLAREIESEKTQAKQLETQIEEMDSRIEEFERQMTSYRLSGETSDYNRLVPSHNSLVNERNAIYVQYSRLVDDVNAKVKLYNSGRR